PSRVTLGFQRLVSSTLEGLAAANLFTRSAVSLIPALYFFTWSSPSAISASSGGLRSPSPMFSGALARRQIAGGSRVSHDFSAAFGILPAPPFDFARVSA